MTPDAEHLRVLREMLDGWNMITPEGKVALTAAIQRIERDDAKALELADAEVTRLRIELDDALERLAGLREKVEAERTRAVRALLDGAPRATTEAQVAAYDFVLAIMDAPKETTE